MGNKEVEYNGLTLLKNSIHVLLSGLCEDKDHCSIVGHWA